MKVVSLLPAATEILYGLGLEPVGVTHECDFPPEALDVPSVTETAVDADADSGTIAEQVSAADDGLYELDREKLRDLDPDLIVTQGVCDVCAIEPTAVYDAVEDLGLDCDVLQVDVHGLDDLLVAIERMGAATEREEQAAGIVAELRQLIEGYEDMASQGQGSPSVVVLDWLDPVMVAGHWIPEIVDRLGGEYGLEDASELSKVHEWDEIREYDPDVLVAAPCGFDLEQVQANIADVTDRPGWYELSAVQNGRAYAMDGNSYVNKPGPGLVETMEYLGALMYPDRFAFPPADVVRPATAAVVEREDDEDEGRSRGRTM